MKHRFIAAAIAILVPITGTVYGQITVTLDWGTLDNLWDASSGSTVLIPDNSTQGIMSFFSYDSATGTEVADIFAHITSGAIGPIGGTPGSAGGFGSTALVPTSAWDPNALLDFGQIGGGLGTVSMDAGVDAFVGGPYGPGTSPLIGDVVYGMFMDLSSGAYGYVFNSQDANFDAGSVSLWAIPSDGGGPGSLIAALGRNTTGDPGTYGTVIGSQATIGPNVTLATPGAGSPVITDAAGWHATNVPEPGTFALFGLGAVALVAYRRRRA
ncbi:MAG: PEP-CTERM sorting domain-containing protein [Verrucomicrobia bacterium]|nr:PEP-CTERM sorting domain-containing protein [Verrucomicrobiota bacterium]